MGETKATATKGAGSNPAPNGEDQAAQDAAKLAEQNAAAEQAEKDAEDQAAQEAADKAEADRIAQEEADKAEADRIAELEKAAAIAVQEEADRIQAEKDKEALEAAEAEAARLEALGAGNMPNFDHAAIVIVAFRDKDDFTKEYQVGDDVSDFEENRLLDVIEKGLVELQGKEEE